MPPASLIPIRGSFPASTASRWSSSSGVVSLSKISSVAPGRGLISSRSGPVSPSRKSAEASPLMRKAAASRSDRFSHLALHRGGERRWLRRAAIAPGAARGWRCPLLAEAEHTRAFAVCHEQRRYGDAFGIVLIIRAGLILAVPAPDDMAAAGAATAFGEPARILRRPLQNGLGVRDAETIEHGKETLRRLDAFNRRRVVAEQWPMFRDPRQQRRPVLEACAIDDAEYGRRRLLHQGIECAPQTLPAHAAPDVAELATSVRDLLRVGVGEEIGNQRRESGAPCARRQRPSRDRRDQQRTPLRM